MIRRESGEEPFELAAICELAVVREPRFEPLYLDHAPLHQNSRRPDRPQLRVQEAVARAALYQHVTGCCQTYEVQYVLPLTVIMKERRRGSDPLRAILHDLAVQQRAHGATGHLKPMGLTTVVTRIMLTL